MSKPSWLCSSCGGPAKWLCSRCNVARYCSKECQEIHGMGHLTACKQRRRNIDIHELCVAVWSMRFTNRSIGQDVMLWPKGRRVSTISVHHGYSCSSDGVSWYRETSSDPALIKAFRENRDLSQMLGDLMVQPTKPKQLPPNFRAFTPDNPMNRAEYFAWWASIDKQRFAMSLLALATYVRREGVTISNVHTLIEPIGLLYWPTAEKKWFHNFLGDPSLKQKTQTVEAIRDTGSRDSVLFADTEAYFPLSVSLDSVAKNFAAQVECPTPPANLESLEWPCEVTKLDFKPRGYQLTLMESVQKEADISDITTPINALAKYMAAHAQ